MLAVLASTVGSGWVAGRCLVELLLRLEDEAIEMVLQLLVRVVDAELLEPAPRTRARVAYDTQRLYAPLLVRCRVLMQNCEATVCGHAVASTDALRVRMHA